MAEPRRDQCAFCNADISAMQWAGQRVHIGKCRARRTLHTLAEYSTEEELDDDDENDDDDYRADEECMSLQPHAGELWEEDDDGAEEDGRRVEDGSAWAPFLSEADYRVAQLYCTNSQISLGAVKEILDISRLGAVRAPNHLVLLRPLDALDGLKYAVEEIHLPGTPDTAIYRLYFRDVIKVVNFSLDHHVRHLTNPELRAMPEDDPEWQVSDVWEGIAYQEALRRFRTTFGPSPVLLPLGLFSGSLVPAGRRRS